MILPPAAAAEIDDLALALLGEPDAEKALAAEDLRAASYRGLLAAGAGRREAEREAARIAGRFVARVEQFELLCGNA